MADYSISQLTEDLTAADSDVVEVAKDNGDGTFTSRKQLRSTLLADKAAQADLDAHEADTTNPHSTTKTQVGLGNADNTADTDKPVSSATQTALDAKADTGHTHTASQVTDFDTEVANNTAVAANTAKNSYPSADATKLAGIEAGAEVNDICTADIADFETSTELNARDTANRSRTNHTGSQAISTVTGLQTELDSKADAADVPATIVESVVAGTNVTVDNTDPANPVVSSSGGGGGTNETNLSSSTTATTVTVASDTGTDATLAAASGTDAGVLTSADKPKLDGVETGATADQTGAEIKTAYEAQADTNAFTDAEQTKLDGIATGATANSSDATLLDRTNHTGTQAASTISNFDTEVSNNADVAANTAARHAATLVGTKTIDETDIAEGKVIAYNATSGNLEYEEQSGGLSNPMTTEGDIILGGASGAATRLAIGTEGQVPTVNAAGTLEYATPSAGGGSASAPRWSLDPIPSPDLWDQDGGSGTTMLKRTRVNGGYAFYTSGASVSYGKVYAPRLHKYWQLN